MHYVTYSARTLTSKPLLLLPSIRAFKLATDENAKITSSYDVIAHMKNAPLSVKGRRGSKTTLSWGQSGDVTQIPKRC
jgi:hypothetical protein